jgi:hypothetical protein
MVDLLALVYDIDLKYKSLHTWLRQKALFILVEYLCGGYSDLRNCGGSTGFHLRQRGDRRNTVVEDVARYHTRNHESPKSVELQYQRKMPTHAVRQILQYLVNWVNEIHRRM